MSAAAAAAATEPERKKGGKGKLLIIVGGVMVLALAGGWFSGVIPGLLGIHASGQTPASEASAHGEGSSAPAAPAHIFVDLPDIVTNLSNGGRRASFIKLQAKLEVAKQDDVAIVQANMPRILDLFQGYLREVRPEELRGTAGTYRLREALLSRVSVAATPANVIDVLFIELLVQ